MRVHNITQQNFGRLLLSNDGLTKRAVEFFCRKDDETRAVFQENILKLDEQSGDRYDIHLSITGDWEPCYDIDYPCSEDIYTPVNFNIKAHNKNGSVRMTETMESLSSRSPEGRFLAKRCDKENADKLKKVFNNIHCALYPMGIDSPKPKSRKGKQGNVNISELADFLERFLEK